MTGWSTTGSGGYHSGAFVGTGGYYNQDGTLPPPADGTHYVTVEGNGQTWSGDGSIFTTDIYQDVGALQANTTYTLTLTVGIESGYTDPSDGFASLLNGTNDTGLTLATGTLSSQVHLVTGSTPPYGGEFQEFTLNYTTGASVSGDLTIELAAISGYPGNGIDFDNVQLNADSLSVPEPSTTFLFSAGVAALLLGVRRRAGKSLIG